MGVPCPCSRSWSQAASGSEAGARPGPVLDTEKLSILLGPAGKDRPQACSEDGITEEKSGVQCEHGGATTSSVGREQKGWEVFLKDRFRDAENYR